MSTYSLAGVPECWQGQLWEGGLVGVESRRVLCEERQAPQHGPPDLGGKRLLATRIKQPALVHQQGLEGAALQERPANPQAKYHQCKQHHDSTVTMDTRGPARNTECKTHSNGTKSCTINVLLEHVDSPVAESEGETVSTKCSCSHCTPDDQQGEGGSREHALQHCISSMHQSRSGEVQDGLDSLLHCISVEEDLDCPQQLGGYRMLGYHHDRSLKCQILPLEADLEPPWLQMSSY